WQLGHMPLEPYTEKHNELAAAMRKADPSVRLVAVGSVGAWTEGMLKGCTAAMDLISEHFYCGQQPGLNGHVRQLANEVRRIATAHRGYRQQLDALRGKDIRIALDEWNYWYGPEVFGQIGTRYFVKDALGVAAGLHEFARQSDIMFMANYAQTVNVIGCIKTSKTAAAFETTGLILKLYRARFGTLPVQTVATPLLDAQAAWTADRKLLTLGVVNTARARQDVALNLRGAKLTGGGTRWELTGEPDSYNEPGAPPKVVITEQRLDGLADNRISVAPCSVTLFALPAEANAAATTR
ncbi:MAG: alpha-L-arabinofuranosidase C-terminal domain-containing protein, partial [Planctomycetota bacterium]